MSTEIIEKINKLKAERNAVILAHNYQVGEVQDIADFTGDSLGLSVQAATTDADVIVFCGVQFMAETAKILSPDKTVLIPEPEAGCPMADMITADQLKDMKAKHPGALVVCYVNSTAEVKAESDYCCTSSNAVDLVSRLPENAEIIFVPDQHLGGFVVEKTGRELILWPGYCSTHVWISAEAIESAKREHPDAVVLAHPECGKKVSYLVDEFLSTGQMLTYAKNSPKKELIIATEIGIIHSLKKANPDKEFYPADNAICPNMKKINLEKVAWALEDMQYDVTVDPDIAAKAKASLDRMLEVIPSR